jgi:hypothetical protein
MRTPRSTVAVFLVLACGPEAEALDEDAFAVCEAFYDAALECGLVDEATEAMSVECSENRTWEVPCRELRRAQLECYTALSCEERENPESERTLACDAAQLETGKCSAEHLR